MATILQPMTTATTLDHRHAVDAPESACCEGDHALEPEPTGSTSDGDDHWSARTAKPTKSVRWSTIIIHEFGVGLGGSAVSNKGGPSIGLADTPEFTWTTRVGEMAERANGLRRFSPSQRIRLLQAAGIPDGIITRHARETNIILSSRRRSKTSWENSDLDESGEEEESEELPRKRSADQAMLEHPCAVYSRRPRMIPANYV